MVPKISVNICCYNGEYYIKKAISSVLEQTFTNYEIIIINDGSTDNSEYIINSFEDKRIKYYYQNNKGLGYSRNKAIELSSGEYISFLDQDDVWLKDKLLKQIKVFDEDSAIGLVYTDAFLIYENGLKLLNSNFKQCKKGYVFKDLLASNFIILSSAIIKKYIIIECGGFPNYNIVEEYALFLNIAKRYKFDYVDEPLTEYIYHDNNLSKYLDLHLKEISNIYNYWSSVGSKDIKIICNSALSRMHYSMSRQALFNLQNKVIAKKYIKISINYEHKLKYYLFYLFINLPLSIIQYIRYIILYTLSK